MSVFELFVYGSLRRGGEFHERFCAGFLDVRDATVEGRLSLLPSGYRILEVPEAEILMEGTADPEADCRSAIDVGRRVVAAARAGAEWQRVAGEILRFDDPGQRLARLDRLEAFRPGATSLYRRVLAPVLDATTGERRPAWLYVAPRR